MREGRKERKEEQAWSGGEGRLFFSLEIVNNVIVDLISKF